MEADEKWPRHYAAEIASMQSREERRAALERVPGHLQSLVKAHVETIWARVKR